MSNDPNTDPAQQVPQQTPRPESPLPAPKQPFSIPAGAPATPAGDVQADTGKPATHLPE